MKILLVDDHPIVRAGCRRMLEQSLGAEVVEACTGREACRLAMESAPDVVILDLTLPGMGGLEVLEALRAQGEGVRVLMFSMHPNPVFAARAIQSGARGYLVKSASPDDLLDAVREILAGGIYLSPEVAKGMALAALCEDADPVKELSSRELEILRLLGKGSDLAGIAAALCLNYKTVANSLTRIKGKLGLRHTGELVRLAIEQGLTDAAEGVKSSRR
jgi:DNA-binding NarL/FixJ family response regulator